MTSVESPLERLAALPPDDRDALIADEARKHGVTPARLKAVLLSSWRFVGRPKQQAPPGDWTYWWIMAGRGFGKTISAAQWTKDRALERRCRIALVAPTRGDVRSIMVEGETGLLSVLPNEALFGQSREIAWNKSLLELTLANQTVITGFSSERPDRLRGPQHDYAWCEEVSSWNDANKSLDALDTTWSNMKLGLRLGARPRAVLTSTPKANKTTRELVALQGRSLVLVKGSSYENRSNLSDAWWNEVVAPLEGTRTGRQEIEAELLEDVEGALWTRATIDAIRIPMPAGWQADPALRDEWLARMARVVVAVDPNTTSGESADAAGIVVAGLGFSDQLGYVLDDRTQVRGGPRAWAQASVDAYHDWKADRIVVETNNGGEMCELVIQGVDATVPVKRITASRGKRTRAEPVSALYERDEAHEKDAKVRHLGAFPELEDEMCLPGDVLVATARGDIPIHEIVRGDLVLTREGLAPVAWAGQTGLADELITVVYPAGSLALTPCHPILDTASDSFVPARSACRGLLLTALLDPTRNTARRSSGEAAGGIGCGRDPSEAELLVPLSCIALSGPPTAARSRVDTRSTTLTATRETTDSRTSNSSPDLSIASGTRRLGSPSGRRKSVEPMRSPSGRRSVLVGSSALNAGEGSSLPGLAPSTARIAATDVLSTAARRLPVYNLRVAAGFPPEFFANGILVHNCSWTTEEESPNRMDALVWALTELKIWRPPSTRSGSFVPRARIPGVVDRALEAGIDGLRY